MKKENNENILYVFRDRNNTFTSKEYKPTEILIGNFLKEKIEWKIQALIFKIFLKRKI